MDTLRFEDKGFIETKEFFFFFFFGVKNRSKRDEIAKRG